MNNSTSLQNSLHQWRRDIYGKRKKVSRGTRTKNSEREAQPKREASRAKARRGKQNGMRIPCGSLCSPQEPLAGLILERTQNGLI